VAGDRGAGRARTAADHDGREITLHDAAVLTARRLT
jgi:hypothetical protein